MNALGQAHLSLGARLAGDNIPLDYGDQRAELDAALQTAVLLDRSHEGRILLNGADRLSLVNRMSTNDVHALPPKSGAPTIFTNPNARILFRALCCQTTDELLLITGAGQGAALAQYLRRNTFYGDRVGIEDICARTAQFALHGPKAKAVLASLQTDLLDLPPFASSTLGLADYSVTVIRRTPIAGGHWVLLCSINDAPALFRHLLKMGAAHGLIPAGSLTYNSLRIRAGRPAGLELSSDYLPLEVGLWDEVSFIKGCYTGQEILARMESRGRLAKILVKVSMSAFIQSPAPVYADGKLVGTLTSSVHAADGEVYALAVIKLRNAEPGTGLTVGLEGTAAEVNAYAGVQPPFVLTEVTTK